MNKKGNAGMMRLNREAKMAKKDIEAQIKKTGKMTDNFICLPDPEDPYVWYYVIFGLADMPYKGGYYMGRIKCPDDYPARAPNIKLMTENGRFRLQEDGICLSISDFHPESWNPAWKVNQIVIGLVSFWLTNEYTYGAVESYDYPQDIPLEDRRVGFAIKSREAVLNNNKFKEIFAPYAKAMGMEEEQKFSEWDEHLEKMAKIEAEKKAQEEERKRKAEEARKAEEERLRKIEEEARIAEELRKAEEEKKRKGAAIKDYFKLLKDKNLTKYIGQPGHAKNALRRLQA